MTPRAATQAGRSTPNRATPGGGGTATSGRRRAIRAQRMPRRVSGPVSGRLGASATAIPAPRIERRRPRTTEPRGRLTVARRAVAFARGLPDHPLLDRVVRGRAWIPLLGLLLAGIVAMQVEVLKLGAGIGRAIQQTAALQSRNQLLRAEVAALADEGRIERLAAAMGLMMPQPVGVTFLDTKRSDAARVAQDVHAPDPAAFQAALSSSGVVATATTSTSGTSLGALTNVAPAIATGSSPASTGTVGGGTGASGTSVTTAAGTTPGATGTTTGATTGTTTSTASPGPSGTVGTAGTNGTAATGQGAAAPPVSAPTGTTTTGGAAAPSGQ